MSSLTREDWVSKLLISREDEIRAEGEAIEKARSEERIRQLQTQYLYSMIAHGISREEAYEILDLKS